MIWQSNFISKPSLSLLYTLAQRRGISKETCTQRIVHALASRDDICMRSTETWYGLTAFSQLTCDWSEYQFDIRDDVEILKPSKMSKSTKSYSRSHALNAN